jgi:hypothetical protein
MKAEVPTVGEQAGGTDRILALTTLRYRRYRKEHKRRDDSLLTGTFCAKPCVRCVFHHFAPHRQVRYLPLADSV